MGNVMIKNNNLTFSKIMWSMAIIMGIWAVFWYPFDLFIFPENLDENIKNILGLSRELLRTLPSLFFLNYYKHELNVNFKDMFSLKFNYMAFFVTFAILAVYFCGGQFLTYGTIKINSNNFTPYLIIQLVCLALCQEITFRGWSFCAFKTVTSQRNAIVISSIFFSTSHWFALMWKFLVTGQFDLINFILYTIFTFVFGIIMCICCIKSENKSIVPCVILHFLWDFL